MHLFFDLDRTLWDFDKNARETLLELFEEYGLADEIPSFTDFHDTYVLKNEACWQAYRNGQLHKQELRTIRFKQTLEHFYVHNQLLVETLGHEYLARCPLKPHLIPDAEQVLIELAKTHTLHIITNGFETTQHTKLKTTRLNQYFNSVITSEGACAKKPYPEIFEFALAKTNVKKELAFMIGDDYDADIMGAARFGMASIWYNAQRTKKSLPKNGREIYQLNELLPIFC